MDDEISPFFKYVLLLILLIVVFAIMWTLRDGFPVRNSGPIQRVQQTSEDSSLLLHLRPNNRG